MKNTKFIFWDCDGTIVDSEPIFLDATRKIFKNYNVEISDDFVQNEYHAKNTNFRELLRQAGFSEQDLLNAKAKRNELYENNLLQQVVLIDGMEEILKFLKGKVPMGIVSNSNPKHLKISFEKFSLKQYFDFIITQDDVMKGKPNPEPYLLALKKSGLKPQECIAIEDNLRGVTSAKSAGIQCFLIPGAMTRKEDYHHADKVVANARELLEYFKTHSNFSTHTIAYSRKKA